MTAVHLYICLSFFGISTFLCDLPLDVFTLFSLISIARFVSKVKGLKYSMNMFQNKRSIGRRTDLSLALPAGVLLLPLATLSFFHFFAHCFTRAPQITESLEETRWIEEHFSFRAFSVQCSSTAESNIARNCADLNPQSMQLKDPTFLATEICSSVMLC